MPAAPSRVAAAARIATVSATLSLTVLAVGSDADVPSGWPPALSSAGSVHAAAAAAAAALAGERANERRLYKPHRVVRACVRRRHNPDTTTATTGFVGSAQQQLYPPGHEHHNRPDMFNGKSTS